MSFDIDPFTDSAIAVSACDAVLRDKFIHVRGIGWLAWTGCVWRETDPDAVIEAVRNWTADQLAEAAARRAPEAELKGWTRWQSVNRVKAAVEFARGMLALPPDRLDAHPDLLNCPNGVVDLRTGELKPSMPWYYFTKVTGSEYDPKAEHPDWAAALTALPESVLTWCQIRYGQGITGHMTPDDRAMVQQGGGANGKSTFLAGIAGALGDYYLASTERLLLPVGRDTMSPEVADLRGARLVAIEETPETGRLDTQRLKALVGTPTISARKLYRDYFTFTASHSIFINTNFTPIVSETDTGTWRRLLLLVFPYTFVRDPLEPAERAGDPELRDRLRWPDQRRAVLAWLVAGAREWYANGFPSVPGIVESDTADWRAQTDHVAAFMSEHLAPADGEWWVSVTDMMRAFNTYMNATGHSGLAEGTFSRRFASHPAVIAAGIHKGQVRVSDRSRGRLTRPDLDSWKTLPPIPDGMIKAWKGVKFRHAEAFETDETGSGNFFA